MRFPDAAIWLLDGQWHEYSGGSRPSTNLVRFSQPHGRGCAVELAYVFDWDTGEREHLLFEIPAPQFKRLVAGLRKSGFSRCVVADGKRTFTFDWRIAEGAIQFRLDGAPRASASGPLSISMQEYRTVLAPRGPLV